MESCCGCVGVGKIMETRGGLDNSSTISHHSLSLFFPSMFNREDKTKKDWGFTLNPPPSSCSVWFVIKTHTPSNNLSAVITSVNSLIVSIFAIAIDFVILKKGFSVLCSASDGNGISLIENKLYLNYFKWSEKWNKQMREKSIYRRNERK
ncbi:MAG: hypothetical protein HW390_2965 [Candidatus Brocadiaceae bacterium]|nr:hypothetical protein [Candidatus Brocadiaceae bacterium]